MSIATRENKLKLHIPQSSNCAYLLVTALDLQAVLLSLSSNSALCYETKWCCHNFTIYDLPPPPTHTHTKLNTLDFGMKTIADLRQIMNLLPVCNITNCSMTRAFCILKVVHINIEMRSLSKA